MPALSSHAMALRRRGVSELFASMLMIGVTLSTGALVVAAAMGQLGLENASAANSASIGEHSAGVQLALIYLVATPSAICPMYDGYREGTILTLALYDYGAQSFLPTTIAVNGSFYSGTYPAVPAAGMEVFSLDLTACAHPSGQTVLAFDAAGEVVQFAS